MLTHYILRSYREGNLTIGQEETAISAGALAAIDETINDGETNKQVIFVLDVSQIKTFYLVSDQAVTVKTNDSGSPVNIFTLAANVPFVWAQGDAAIRDTAGAVVTTDITTLYITNASGSNAEVKLRSLYDPTA